jgi:hypothetical protein
MDVDKAFVSFTFAFGEDIQDMWGVLGFFGVELPKQTTLIFHIGNYSRPLQIIVKNNNVRKWELRWPTIIKQISVVVQKACL